MSDAALAEIAAEPTPVAPRSETWARRGGWAVIALGTLLAYANSFQTPFIFDGANYLKEADTIRTLWPPDVLYRELKDLGVMTRAVVYISFAIDYFVYHYDVRGWHATSIAIHIAAALALYGLARHGFASRRAQKYFAGVTERAALVVALVWAVHPLNTQSVTYLYQRQESLMGMFYLLTLYGLSRHAATGAVRWGMLSVAACCLGMGSKEVMITAPLTALWYDRIFCAHSWRELLRRRWGYYCFLAASWGVLYVLMHQTWNNYASAGILDESRITRMEYALTQPGVIVRYLRLSVVPYGLNIDYAWPKALQWPLADEKGAIVFWPKDVDWPPIMRGLAVVGGLGLLTLIAVFRAPAIGFLGGAFFTILAPSSSIAPIVDLCFEHRMYLALAPLVALGVVGVHRIFQAIASRARFSPPVSSAVETVVVWLVVAVLIALTLLRNYDYRSEVALWGDAARKAPKNHRAHYNYGVYLQIEGQIDPAIEQYFLALKYDPNYAEAFLNLGNLALWRNQLEDAEGYYHELLRRIPDHADGLYGMADIYRRRGDPTWARYYLDQLLLAHPEHAEGQAMLKEVQAALERSGAKLRPAPGELPAPSGSQP